MTNTAFLEEKNKNTNAPIYLYTVYDYDDLGTNLNLAEWGDDVTFDGIVYNKFPIKHDEIGENSQGQVPSIKLTVANVSRVIQYYLETYNWRGKKVLIRLVWLAQIADADAKLDFVYYIDSYIANEKIAEFVLLPKVNALGLELPKRTYSRNYCQWRFKGTECGYASGESECNKTKQRCKELGNYSRYGGFPAIPTRRLYV